MTTSPIDDAVLRQYLLGQLSESERQRLEESYFDDDEVFAALLSVEEELAGDYLGGRLSPAERALFEQELTTPGGRQRLWFAHAEARVASRLEDADGLDARSEAAPAAPPSRAPMSGWQWAAAAALLLALGSTAWMFAENRRFRGELTRATATRDESRRMAQAALEQAEAERSKVATLQAELAERNRNPRPTPGLITLTLLPGLRDSGGPPTLLIRPGVAVVALQMGIDSVADLNALRLTLTRQSGDIVTRVDVLQLNAVAADGVLTVSVPAAALSPGAYRALLEHLPRRGAPEPLRTYEFRVASQ